MSTTTGRSCRGSSPTLADARPRTGAYLTGARRRVRPRRAVRSRRGSMSTTIACQARRRRIRPAQAEQVLGPHTRSSKARLGRVRKPRQPPAPEPQPPALVRLGPSHDPHERPHRPSRSRRVRGGPVCGRSGACRRRARRAFRASPLRGRADRTLVSSRPTTVNRSASMSARADCSRRWRPRAPSSCGRRCLPPGTFATRCDWSTWSRRSDQSARQR